MNKNDNEQCLSVGSLPKGNFFSIIFSRWYLLLFKEINQKEDYILIIRLFHDVWTINNIRHNILCWFDSRKSLVDWSNVFLRPQPYINSLYLFPISKKRFTTKSDNVEKLTIELDCSREWFWAQNKIKFRKFLK